MASLLNMSGGSLLGKGGLLPSGYTQLEYIENTSTAYIDTGIYFQSGMDCYVTYSIEEITNYGYIFGVQNISGKQNIFRLHAQSLTYSVCIVTGIVQNIGIVTLHKKCSCRMHIENSNNFISVDSEVLYSNTRSQTAGVQTIFMFAGNTNKNAGMFGKIKIYSAKYVLNGDAIRYFIPCINPQNVVGMYDTVNGVFYSSPNGTAFIAGPEV